MTTAQMRTIQYTHDKDIKPRTLVAEPWALGMLIDELEAVATATLTANVLIAARFQIGIDKLQMLVSDYRRLHGDGSDVA